MAQKVVVELTDDLDGSEAAETVTFGLDGVEYEIDLSDDNASELRDALAQYVEHGRKTGGRRQSGRSTRESAVKSKPDREQTRAIREWAQTQGYDVSDRGRIPKDVVDAYQNAKKGRAK